MPYRAPETLTTAEQERLLEVSSRHPNPRDHLLFSIALGTGLRLSELLGLDVRHVTADGRTARTRVQLDRSRTKGQRRGEVFLPDRLVRKIERYLAWKRLMGEPLGPDAPLFVSTWRTRLSPRRTQMIFHEWQRRASFDRTYGFHALRHSAVTNGSFREGQMRERVRRLRC